MRGRSLKIVIVMLALNFETGCSKGSDIAGTVRLLQSASTISNESVMNPLDFIQEVPIPGPTFAYERGDEQSFQKGLDDVNEQKKKFEFENVGSSEFLKRIAAIPETIEPSLQGKIHVNSTYQPNHINIYFLTAQITPKALRGACAYVGYGGVILCDGQSLRGIIDKILGKEDFFQLVMFDASTGRRLRKDEMDKETLTTSQAYIAGGFLSWVLAHEVGHYVNDYGDIERKGNIAHFSNNDLLSVREVRADQFAAESIGASHLGATICGISLLEFMATELSEFAPFQKDLTKAQLDTLRNGELPEKFRMKLDSTPDSRLLVRAASVGSVLSRLGNFGDGGFSSQILSSVKVSGSRIESFINWSPYFMGGCVFALCAYFILGYVRSRRS